MTRFSYKAVSANGDILEGELEAENRDAVVERLRAQGHLPIKAEAQKRRSGRAGGGSLSGLFQRKTVSRKDVVLLTQELATLLQAGLPLDRALTVLGELSPHRPVREMVEQILDAVKGGATLGDALERFPEVFPNIYVGMVRAGEAGGSLETVLQRLGETLEKAQALRESVKSALQYPLLVLIMAGLTLGVMMTLVIPEFTPIFEGAGAELPLATKGIIAVSDFLRAYWWALLVGIVILAVGFQRYIAQPAGRLWWDSQKLRIPMIGDLITKVEAARFSRTFGTLLQNGVSVINAINMTIDTLENVAVVKALGGLCGSLETGRGLADPLTDSEVFPHLAVQLIRVGEESGQLENMLLKVAAIYDEEVNRTVARVMSLLVPLITIVLGIVVAIIIGSILQAMLGAYDLPF